MIAVKVHTVSLKMFANDNSRLGGIFAFKTVILFIITNVILINDTCICDLNSESITIYQSLQWSAKHPIIIHNIICKLHTGFFPISNNIQRVFIFHHK